jgi:WD40 repeat protein
LLACGGTDAGHRVSPYRIFSLADGSVVRELPHDGMERGTPLFSRDGKWLAIGDNLDFRLWETQTWERKCTIPRGDTGYQGFMDFSADGATLAVSLSRHMVELIETDTGQELAQLEAPEASDIYHLRFSPDGGRFAVTYRDGTIALWDLALLRAELAAMKLDWRVRSPSLSGSSAGN